MGTVTHLTSRRPGSAERRIGHRLGLDKSVANRVARELHAVAHFQLLQNIRAVSLDRLLADPQELGYLLSRVTLGDQLDDLELARCQGVPRCRLSAPGTV